MMEMLEVLKYVLPALIVMLTSFWLVKRFLGQEKEKQMQKQKQLITADILKVRLQAYERVLLFLERIRPQNLILRNDASQTDANGFRRMLLENIRMEFEHNLVQQLYISGIAWEKLNVAKGWVTRILNEAAEKNESDQSANDFAIKILELAMAAKDNPVQAAIDFVKQEVSELF